MNARATMRPPPAFTAADGNVANYNPATCYADSLVPSAPTNLTIVPSGRIRQAP
jgi:hypothetical protein